MSEQAVSPEEAYRPQPVVGDRATLEKTVGRDLPPDLFTFQPWGHRLVVARVAPAGKINVTRDDGTNVEIIIPKQAEKIPAVGWVISAGPEVGLYRPDYVGTCPIDPKDLIGRKVLFGMYAGQEILVGDQWQNEFESLYTLLTDNDVWGTLG